MERLHAHGDAPRRLLGRPRAPDALSRVWFPAAATTAPPEKRFDGQVEDAYAWMASQVWPKPR